MCEPTDPLLEIERPGTIKRRTENLADLIGDEYGYRFDFSSANSTFTIGDLHLENVQTIDAKVIFADVPNAGTMVILKHPDVRKRPKGVIGVLVAPDDAPSTKPEVDGVWVADEGDGVASGS